jgi:hypothetical protein
MCRVAVLQVGLVLVAITANAAASKDTVRIIVLDSVTRASTPDNNGVPQNCEQLTFDAYCRSTSSVPVISTLLVQEDNEPPYRITCTADSKYSRCVSLAKGESFDAKREKHGLAVYYVDDKGKMRKQLYALVASDAKPSQPPPAAGAATQPLPASGAPRQSLPSPVPAPSVSPTQAAPPEKAEKVKCNFTSTPAGAEITLDGKFVGSTPSAISLSPGTHVVVFTVPGFAQWKRDLTVLPGSELTVGAILQKE